MREPRGGGGGRKRIKKNGRRGSQQERGDWAKKNNSVFYPRILQRKGNEWGVPSGIFWGIKWAAERPIRNFNPSSPNPRNSQMAWNCAAEQTLPVNITDLTIYMITDIYIIICINSSNHNNKKEYSNMYKLKYHINLTFINYIYLMSTK